MTPLVPVKNSSTVARIGYDHSTKTLAIHFKTGRTYHYQDVPVGVWDGLQQAESKGQYLAKHIRGKFSHQSHEA